MKIERNYRKNPHTANFLMSFHTGGQGLPADLDGENDYMTPVERDLLNLVPVEVPTYRLSPAQIGYISDLTLGINALNADLGEQAASYTARMDREGRWTRENVRRWIDNLKAKRAELRAAAPDMPVAAPVVTVENGRYAVEEGGTLRFFRVKNGRKAGFVFLDIQASDEWYPIRAVVRISQVLALIAVDPRAAMVRYGHELGECGRCGRVLTDEASRAAGIGPVCIDK